MTIQPILLIEKEADYSSEVFAESLNAMMAAANTLGIEIVLGERDRISQQVKLHGDIAGRPIVPFGSISFIRDIHGVVVDSYGFNIDWNNTAYAVGRNLLANRDYSLVQWHDLRDNLLHWSGQYDYEKLFVRPVSGRKTFPGVVMEEDAAQWFKMMEQTTSVTDTTACVIALEKQLGNEYRAFIVDGKLIDIVPYVSKPGRAHIAKAKGFAKSIIEKITPPAPCYTLDIAVAIIGSTATPQVVEMNSMCCSGLYKANAEEILRALTAFAVAEHADIWGLNV